MADEMAPDGQCYIVIAENISSYPVQNSVELYNAVKKADINPKYIEIYQIWPSGDRFESYFVTLGKTYKDLWLSKMNMFPGGTKCSSGKGFMSNKMFYLEETNWSTYNLATQEADFGLDLIESKVMPSRRFLSNEEDYIEVTASYSEYLKVEAENEAIRIKEIEAAKEAERIALARAAEEEANRKAAAEAAALKAIADAEEAKRIEKENRRAWWINLLKWISIIFLSFIAFGAYARKKEATKAGFDSVKAYEQHKKEKREEEERLKKEAEDKARLEAIKKAEEEKKERELKAAKKAGFNSVKEHKAYLRKKEALDAGFSTVKEYEDHLRIKKAEEDAERKIREAEARAREAEARAREAEAKAGKDSSDGSLLKTAAGAAVTAAAVKAVQRPPRVVFNDPSYKVGEIKRAGLLPISGWKIRWYKVDHKGKKIKNGTMTRKKPGVFKNKASISHPCKGYIYWE